MSYVDERIEHVDRKIDQAEESRRQQEEQDVRALSLANQQLDPPPGSQPIPQDKLNEAIAAASDLIRIQIFGRATEQRRRTWNATTPAEQERMERTIPLFRALVAADPEGRYHRSHAQLGYALKDKRQPEYAAAEQELSEAIRIRDQGFSTAQWLPLNSYTEADLSIEPD